MAASNGWSGKRVCVSGGAGFLGSFVTEALRQRGAREVFVTRMEQYDLVKIEDVRRMYEGLRRTIEWYKNRG